VKLIELFTRPGCHLCDEAKRILVEAQRRSVFSLIEHNVEDDPEWEREYGVDIPVVLVDGRKAFKHRIEKRALERYLER
jgi:glutaredoxin